MSKDISAILETSKSILKENNVAVLGPSGTGKTVFITLLSHAMDNHFVDEHPDLKVYPKDGLSFLETCENSMRNGEFPERTQQLSRNKIVYEMSGTGLTARKVEFKFPDISGEDYAHMCLGDEIRGKERVLKVFEMGKAKGSTYGPMSYAVYAKMYVILLDCSKFADWENLQTQYTQALTTIHDFKIESNTARNGKIDVPIAVVLTKADTLPDRNIKPEDLVRTKMRRFYNTLDAVHGGKREFFMVHVDIKRNREHEIDSSDGIKPAHPLSYSHKEYVRFLWWLHQNLE